ARSVVPPCVHVLEGDGLAGDVLDRALERAERAFDAVVAGFALPGGVPAVLGRVLRVGGVVVAPVQSDGAQQLHRAVWNGEAFATEPLENVHYVPYRASV